MICEDNHDNMGKDGQQATNWKHRWQCATVGVGQQPFLEPPLQRNLLTSPWISFPQTHPGPAIWPRRCLHPSLSRHDLPALISTRDTLTLRGSGPIENTLTPRGRCARTCTLEWGVDRASWLDPPPPKRAQLTGPPPKTNPSRDRGGGGEGDTYWGSG